MPRPQPKTITFSIDGREVQAPDNMMLADEAPPEPVIQGAVA